MSQFGLEPLRIDFLVHIKGVDFDTVWNNRVVIRYSGLDIPFISLADLLANKRAVGRAKDEILNGDDQGAAAASACSAAHDVFAATASQRLLSMTPTSPLMPATASRLKPVSSLPSAGPWRVNRRTM